MRLTSFSSALRDLVAEVNFAPYHASIICEETAAERVGTQEGYAK